LQDFQTPHEKNLQGQLMVCTEMKIQAVFCKQEKKRVSKSQVCCVQQYRKAAPNKWATFCGAYQMDIHGVGGSS